MIKHIVCFKLKESSPEACREACDLLRSMEGRVPQVRALFAGADFLRSPRSYDVVLEVLVDDRAALDAYQQDPYHSETVKPYMHRVRESSIAVDVCMDEH